MSMKNGIPILSTPTMGFNGHGNKVLHYPNMYPHCLLVGKTGSGKSYAARSWLANFISCYPKTKLSILDFKGEFGYSSGKRYYSHLDCMQGLLDFAQEMLARQKDPYRPKTPWLLYIDELAALVTFLDKKQSDEFKRILSTVYMLSRAQNMFTISAVQRADANTWTAGARDNISLVVLLGELSKESCDMFSLDKSQLSPCPFPGMGHVLVNGSPDSLMKIRTLPIPNMNKVDEIILNALD